MTERPPEWNSVGDMTLGDAMRLRRPESWYACACIGGPFCCFLQATQRDRLHRSAHIVARLMFDFAQKKEEQ